ncbi:CRISPR-associated protein Cas4 [Saccharothrix violaceirubra]|uniref:CRISPR-associated exonuclease Cas4 n=1 Tax=Saccharothrix violaceirubra TaxID=413306 RepID=A0A7W7T1B7_9PSEU|nr:CRISPR-associated protein Cas4 [Saccharothrix violaceirubra]MBB4963480.1 CRISPR-associated exonuclease Cas4 [Saccharothrix violaceirubra]
MDSGSVPISALEHYAYCPRQAGLIHVDGYFESNVDTVRGDLAHATVDRPGPDTDRRGHRVWHSLPVWHDELGLHGICDTVHLAEDGPVPAEHKSGGYRPGGPADLQVAAQVLCLREMFDAPVPIGLVFTGRDRRRHEVVVDHELADRVARATEEIRRMRDTAVLPPPVADTRCRRCSLKPGCLPETTVAVRAGLFVPREVGDWDD